MENLIGKYQEDLQILSRVSNLALSFKRDNYLALWDAHAYLDGESYLTFHPSGECGCLLCNDGYLFGIRCDHLIYIEGWVESEEPFTEGAFGRNVIMLIANHKGITVIDYLIGDIGNNRFASEEE